MKFKTYSFDTKITEVKHDAPKSVHAERNCGFHDSLEEAVDVVRTRLTQEENKLKKELRALRERRRRFERKYAHVKPPPPPERMNA